MVALINLLSVALVGNKGAAGIEVFVVGRS